MVGVVPFNRTQSQPGAVRSQLDRKVSFVVQKNGQVHISSLNFEACECLIQLEEELDRRGHWNLVFPTSDAEYAAKCCRMIGTVTDVNRLQLAWMRGPRDVQALGQQ